MSTISVCGICHHKKVVCGRCEKTMCPNCQVVEYIDTTVAKGWFCIACFGGPTELNDKLRKFSKEHGSPDTLILKYEPNPQTTLG